VHELSIAHSIVEIVCRVARREGSPRVLAVHVVAGDLSCLVKDSLEFCFDLTARGTEAQGAVLYLERRKVVIYCIRCEANSELETLQQFRCPKCGDYTAHLVSGRELSVDRVELEESHAPC
jgi:hydrogenase nickel incorporation protein HypA/HybF